MDLDYSADVNPADKVNMIMWSGIEACASTICANLPCYAPLLKRGSNARGAVNTVQTVFATALRRDSPKKSFVEIESMEGERQAGTGNWTTVVGAGGATRKGEADVEMGGIWVETTVGAERAGSV